MDSRTVYDALGEDAFHRLTAVFYAGVATDALLRPLYPDENLEAARNRLALFLIQYFGGPTTYSDERGHPRLRMRHAAYPIDTKMRDAWMSHMLAALDAQAFRPEVDAVMRSYFEDAATFLINHREGPRETNLLIRPATGS